ncbi:MAG: tig [Alphaproteobacteria bacterium]|jgi:trigger factor|nr:tig [Alphaproteobacteria bacterium]
MQVTETANEGLKRQFKIQIPASDISGEVEKRLDEMGKTARLPGFRPGKVPKSLLKKQYGQALMGEIVERRVNESSQKTIDERGLRPAAQPKVEITKFAEGEDLEFSVDLEVLPEIAQPEYSSIELERMKVEVTDEMVNETLERMAKQSREKKPAAEGKAAEKGDVVVIDFLGKIDDKAFENGAATDFELELGSNAFIPGFEDQLVGARAGDKRDVKVNFPDEYGAKELAGKAAVFECTIKQVMEFADRAIDDELAKANGFDTLDALKKAVRERLEQEFAMVARARTKRQLLDVLAAKADFAAPPSLIQTEFDVIWQRVDEARKQGEKVGEGDEETLKQEYRDIATRRVKLGLLLAEIGRQNNIQVSQDEMNRAVMTEAQRYPGQERQVFEFFQNNANARATLRAPLFEDKTVDFIIEMAKVSDRPVSRDELLKEPEEDDKAKA